MELQHANVLITGGSRGLGRAMAIAFAEAGASNVFINHLNDAEQAEETRQAIESRHVHAAVIEADIADPEAVKSMAERTSKHLGGIALDILVNNAGIILRPSDWLAQSDDDLARTLMVDLAGAMHCTRAFAPAMRAAGKGCIINIASDNGIAGSAAVASYAAAKAGVIQYTKNMAVGLAPNVRVNAIAPGVCNTDMTRAAGQEVVDSA